MSRKARKQGKRTSTTIHRRSMRRRGIYRSESLLRVRTTLFRHLRADAAYLIEYSWIDRATARASVQREFRRLP